MCDPRRISGKFLALQRDSYEGNEQEIFQIVYPRNKKKCVNKTVRIFQINLLSLGFFI